VCMHSTVGYMPQNLAGNVHAHHVSHLFMLKGRKGIKRAGFLSNKERRVHEDRKVRGH